jgi:hypothetical protein
VWPLRGHSAKKRQRTSLLIVRTRRIFTAVGRVARDARMFQHIASCTDGIASVGGNELTVEDFILLSFQAMSP